MITYLVTGDAGFIGSHLCELLLAQGQRVLIIDNLSTGRLENIDHHLDNPNFHFARANITDEIVLDRLASQADVIVHLAAAVGVQLIVERPVHTIETNIMGTEHVLRAALRYGCRTLTGLNSDTTYHYQISSVDSSGNAASSIDATFTTTDGNHIGGIVSDDFNACVLDSGLWSFVDPVGDGSVAVNGRQLLLSVPVGVALNVWNGGNNAPRLMQAVNDTDFEIEVKYESLVSEKYEMQGIIMEQDADNYLRFDFYGKYGQVTIFAARIEGGAATAIANVAISVPNQPVTMHVERAGDSWTLSYSLDGTAWTTSSSFSHSLAVSQVGVFAGNAGLNPPAHTAVVDCFFNTATPIVPEDANGSLTCN